MVVQDALGDRHDIERTRGTTMSSTSRGQADYAFVTRTAGRGSVADAARQAAAAAARWRDPRITRFASDHRSAVFQLAWPLELPTRVRVSWSCADDGTTEVRVSARNAAGLSKAARRLLERFSDLLAHEMDAVQWIGAEAV